MSSSRRDLFRAAAAAAPRRRPLRPRGGRRRRRRSRPRSSSATAASSCSTEWGEAEQLRLRDASVLVVGAGALGSPVAHVPRRRRRRPARASSTATTSSSRTSTASTCTSRPDVGAPKAHSAAAKLRLLNPEVEVEPYQVHLDETNAEGLVAGHDLVVDCSDSFATRYAVNAACCAAGIPLVEGGVVGWNGLVLAIRPGESACYRCVFPQEPAPGTTPTCAEAGVLGPGAGVVGSLQAMEALKLLAELPVGR